MLLTVCAGLTSVADQAENETFEEFVSKRKASLTKGKGKKAANTDGEGEDQSLDQEAE